MQYLDPSWLSVELTAIQQEQQTWDNSLKASYDASMQRVFAFQERGQETAPRSNQVDQPA